MSDEIIEIKKLSSEIFLLKKFKYMYFYMVILILIILSLIIIIFNVKYDLYYITKGFIIRENNNYYIKIYPALSDIKKIVNSNGLKLNNKSYKYDIVKIDGELVIDNVNMTNYKEVILYALIEDKELILNNVIDIKIKYNEVLISNLIYNFITGKE